MKPRRLSCTTRFSRPTRSLTERPIASLPRRELADHCGATNDEKPTRTRLIDDLLQFFCTRCPYQPNATTMRTTAGVIVNPCKITETDVIPISALRQMDADVQTRIRSSQEGVGSSSTFGADLDHSFSTTRLPLGATAEVVPSNVNRTCVMTPVSPSKFEAPASGTSGSPRK